MKKIVVAATVALAATLVAWLAWSGGGGATATDPAPRTSSGPVADEPRPTPAILGDELDRAEVLGSGVSLEAAVDAPLATSAQGQAAELLVRLVEEPGGPGIRDVGVTVDVGGVRSSGTTEEDGGARFEDLPLGQVIVLTGRGAKEYGRLLAGSNVIEIVRWGDHRLRGLVENEGGEPIPGATIRVGNVAFDFQPPVAAVADDAGRFELQHLGRSFQLHVAAPGHAATLVDRIHFRHLATTHPLTVVLAEESARCTVEVVDLGGAALFPATVEVRPATTGRPRRWHARRFDVGPDGTIEVGGLSEGTWSFTAYVPGSAAAAKVVELTRGRTEVRLELGPGVVVVGRASAQDAGAFDGLDVLGSTEDRLVAPLGKDGEFRLEGLRPGSIELSLRSRFGAPLVTRSFRAGHGETIQWNPRVPSTDGRIRGRVADGAEPGPWRVYAYGESTDFFRAATVGDDLEFELPCGGDDTYRVCLARPSRPGSFADVMDGVVCGQEGLILIAQWPLKREGTIRGRFGGGSGAKGLSVVACWLSETPQLQSLSQPEPVEGSWMRVDADGSFTLDGLIDGRYAVWAMADTGQYGEVAVVELTEASPAADLGILPVPRPATLRILWSSEGGPLPEELSGSVVTLNKGVQVLSFEPVPGGGAVVVEGQLFAGAVDIRLSNVRGEFRGGVQGASLEPGENTIEVEFARVPFPPPLPQKR